VEGKRQRKATSAMLDYQRQLRRGRKKTSALKQATESAVVAAEPPVPGDSEPVDDLDGSQQEDDFVPNTDDSSCSTILSCRYPPSSRFLHSAERNERKGVTVLSTRTKSAGHRVWDKRYYCLYCAKSVSRLPRHLYSAHADEHAVAEVMSAGKKKKQTLLTKIRNLGNEAHNRNVLTTGSRKLVVVYWPNEDVDLNNSQYIPCQFCHGYFSRRQLWRHAKRCSCKPVGVQSCLHPVAAGDLLLPCK